MLKYKRCVFMIELQGTLKERLEKAIELVSTEVTKEEIENFKNIYEKANIKLSQAAIDFYKKYGGVYRNKYVLLNDPTFNKEFCFLNLIFLKHLLPIKLII